MEKLVRAASSTNMGLIDPAAQPSVASGTIVLDPRQVLVAARLIAIA